MTTVPPGDYVIDITANVGTTSKKVSFILTIVDPCLDQVSLTIPTIVHLIDKSYDLGASQSSQTWQES